MVVAVTLMVVVVTLLLIVLVAEEIMGHINWRGPQ